MSIRKLFVPALALAGLLLSPLASQAGPPAAGCAVPTDLNGDGKSDIVYEKTAGLNQGLVNIRLIDGIAQIGNTFPLTLPAAQDLIGAGSFNGSGTSQLLSWNPSTGLLRVIALTPTASGIASSAFPATIGAGWFPIGIFDMDNDGVDDVVFVRISSPNVGNVRVVLMNSDFTVKSTVFPTFIPTGFVPLGVADMDGNGVGDIVAVKTSAPNLGLYRVFLLGAGAATVASSTFPGTVPTGLKALGLGCFNEDTQYDILLRNPSTGLARIQNTGTGATSFSGSSFPFTFPAGFTPRAIGNYDGANAQDVASNKDAAPNAGNVRVFNLNAAGSAVATTGFPSLVNPEFTLIRNIVVAGLP